MTATNSFVGLGWVNGVGLFAGGVVVGSLVTYAIGRRSRPSRAPAAAAAPPPLSTTISTLSADPIVATLKELTAAVQQLAKNSDKIASSTLSYPRSDAGSVYYDMDDEQVNESYASVVSHGVDMTPKVADDQQSRDLRLTMPSSVHKTMEQSDQLDAQGLVEESVGPLVGALTKLSSEDVTDNKVLAAVHWRLARALYSRGEAAADSISKEADWAEGLRHAQKAAQLDDSSSEALKWRAIMRSSHAEFGGNAKQIETAHHFKEDISRAIELAPNDFVLHHLLGRWSFEIAQLGWLQRRAASALFGAPPTATLEEALAHFERAEELQPGKWKTNLLMLGKTEYNMSHREKAIAYLEQASRLPSISADDRKSQAEIEKLLSSM